MEAIDIKMIEELQKNCQESGKTLVDLLKIFDLTELGREMWREGFKEIYNKVLAEHEFYAKKECARCEVKKGARITDEQYTFLLEDADHDEYLKLIVAETSKAGLTDEKGYYTDNWDKKVCDARNELYQFICEHILPEGMRQQFWNARMNVTTQYKLISIIKSAFQTKKSA